MNKSDLQEGDIIFIAIKHLLYRQVAKGTGSKTSHVGIVLKDENGHWVVAESAVPFVKYSSLDDFVKRSEYGWHCVRRMKKKLTPEQIKLIKVECDKRMGTLYHLGFKFDSKRLFCSKFVYQVFQSALGVTVGRLETFKQLHQRLPHIPLTFWHFWYFGFIPWERVTITPASQMESPLLSTVYDTSLANLKISPC